MITVNEMERKLRVLKEYLEDQRKLSRMVGDTVMVVNSPNVWRGGQIAVVDSMKDGYPVLSWRRMCIGRWILR